MKQVGIVGAGTMGFGISFYLAVKGVRTHVIDVSEKSLELAKEKFHLYYQTQLSHPEMSRHRLK